MFAACFKKYCVQECRKIAAEHAATDVDSLPKDVDEAIDGPLPANAAQSHDVPMRVLTSVVDAVCGDFEVQRVY